MTLPFLIDAPARIDELVTPGDSWGVTWALSDGSTGAAFSFSGLTIKFTVYQSGGTELLALASTDSGSQVTVSGSSIGVTLTAAQTAEIVPGTTFKLEVTDGTSITCPFNGKLIPAVLS